MEGRRDGWMRRDKKCRFLPSSLPDIETESALRTKKTLHPDIPSVRQCLVKSASEAKINLCGGERYSRCTKELLDSLLHQGFIPVQEWRRVRQTDYHCFRSMKCTISTTTNARFSRMFTSANILFHFPDENHKTITAPL